MSRGHIPFLDIIGTGVFRISNPLIHKTADPFLLLRRRVSKVMLNSINSLEEDVEIYPPLHGNSHLQWKAGYSLLRSPLLSSHFSQESKSGNHTNINVRGWDNVSHKGGVLPQVLACQSFTKHEPSKKERYMVLKLSAIFKCRYSVKLPDSLYTRIVLTESNILPDTFAYIHDFPRALT